MRILLDLVSKELKPSRAMAPIIRYGVLSLAAANRVILQGGKVPAIYLSGVRYRQEPQHWPIERFDNAETCWKRGWGDCDDLAAWRCAELWNQGIKAGIIVSWKPTPSGRLYHITVRLPDGRKEDPSARLGMRT